jgi:PAS domain S-box-containing protein
MGSSDQNEDKSSNDLARRLAAIVESSDDAIVSKDLNSIIKSWNRGAERIFGYTPDEVIGKPITILMPQDRLDEEEGILARIKAGERIEHYETIRRRKDGTLLNISLTVSPIRNAAGQVVGASKIARDVTDRKKLEEERELLMAELNHRVKNTLATVISIERLSFSSNADVNAAREGFRSRLRALARAHERLAEANWRSILLQNLVEDAISPYIGTVSNIAVSGPSTRVNARSALRVGLAVNELATNAAKYGSLSSVDGSLGVDWNVDDDGVLELRWVETGGPLVSQPTRVGFGRMLLEQALTQELDSQVILNFDPKGLQCSIQIPRRKYETSWR